MTVWQYLLGGAAGGLVGLILGLVGGGGSILAVPLLVHLVGVTNPHVALGTSALGVAANAAFGAVAHARRRTIHWPSAWRFALAGVAGAAAGSTIGLAIDGRVLLGLFALVMLLVAGLMLRPARPGARDTSPGAAMIRPGSGARTLGAGAATGLFSGVFGIGGGFLIVPALLAATGMGMVGAVGTSLVAITAFGATTAANYARVGAVDGALAAAFIAGGAVGAMAGAALGARLAGRETLLKRLFADVIAATALIMLIDAA